MNRNEHGFWRFGMSLAVEHDTTPAPEGCRFRHTTTNFEECAQSAKRQTVGYVSGQNTINAGTAVSTIINDSGKPRRG